MGTSAGRIAIGAVALVVLGFAGTAHAADPAITIGADGKTAPVFDYTKAVRERVFIPQPGVDQDSNGKMDFVTADIIRPKESGPGVEVPAIIDPSPYYTTVCRGNEGQCMADWDADGVNDRWPLFYDNYFVPRGYAYVLGQMLGTGYTTEGCPNHGGPEDIAGEKSIVDWLNGRAPAYEAPDVSSQQVVADWHNGSSAMIGKSYDGTLANGVAATGVEGLKTVVPIAAISAWYHYSRTGGVRHNNDYPGGSLNRTITTGSNPPPGVDLPDRRPLCADLNAFVNTIDGDAHGDVNEFWRDRDYVEDASNIKAAVFAVHGFQDDNVRMDHLGLWWDALKANGMPRKLWLMRTGHTEAFEVRRAEWVDTLHRWFDHYLHGVANGIDTEPPVTIEDEMDVWREYADWPVPGTAAVNVFLRGTSEAAPGTLAGSAGGRGGADTLTFTGSNSVGETTYISNPDGAQTNRRVFLSQPLKADVRLSGTPRLDLKASLSTEQTNLGVLVVDYSDTPFTMVSRSGNGVTNTTTRTCWGATSDGTPCEIGDTCTASPETVETACYLEVSKRTDDVTQWRVTRGGLDSSNRDSLWYQDATPVTIDEKDQFSITTMPTEHTFKAGHRIGMVVTGHLIGRTDAIEGGQPATNGSVITVDAKTSKIMLPIVGGRPAALEAGVF
ncbi:MAG: CocE/NonD family hydrolase [Actinomycetota bacterium]|nr:CocE/NonD family hydrolase [Actinomycetota bacterium]